MNEDYEIRINADKNGNLYWRLFKKGEPAACNEREIKMVADVCIEIRDKIVCVYD